MPDSKYIIKKAYEYFTSTSVFPDPKKVNKARVFDSFTDQEILQVIRMSRNDTESLQVIIAYCRRFKDASDTITIHELQEVRKLLCVKKVHDT